MTFNATIENISLFVNSLSSISEIIDEGTFKITSTGISLSAADRAMVAVVNFHLSKSAFKNYELDDDQEISLSLGNLLSVLKRATLNDILKFELKDNKLKIEIIGSSKRKFIVPLLELKKEEVPQTESLEFTSNLDIKSKILQSGIDDAEIVSDSVLLECLDGKFIMRSEGDISSSELEIENVSDDLTNIKSSNVKSRYPLDYLKKIMKAGKMSDSINLQFGKNYPLKISFKSDDNYSLQFILAPRVSDE